jgi:hypothetical protein
MHGNTAHSVATDACTGAVGEQAGVQGTSEDGSLNRLLAPDGGRRWAAKPAAPIWAATVVGRRQLSSTLGALPLRRRANPPTHSCRHRPRRAAARLGFSAFPHRPPAGPSDPPLSRLTANLGTWPLVRQDPSAAHFALVRKRTTLGADLHQQTRPTARVLVRKCTRIGPGPPAPDGMAPRAARPPDDKAFCCPRQACPSWAPGHVTPNQRQGLAWANVAPGHPRNPANGPVQPGGCDRPSVSQRTTGLRRPPYYRPRGPCRRVAGSRSGATLPQVGRARMLDIVKRRRLGLLSVEQFVRRGVDSGESWRARGGWARKRSAT